MSLAPARLCKLFPRSLSRSSRDPGAGTASRGCCRGRTRPGCAKNTLVLSRGSVEWESRWPYHSRLLQMQLATFEINLPLFFFFFGSCNGCHRSLGLQPPTPPPRPIIAALGPLHSAPAPFPGRTQPPPPPPPPPATPSRSGHRLAAS